MHGYVFVCLVYYFIIEVFYALLVYINHLSIYTRVNAKCELCGDTAVTYFHNEIVMITVLLLLVLCLLACNRRQIP